MVKRTDNPELRVIQDSIKKLGYNSVRYTSTVRVPKHVKPCPIELGNRLRAMELIGAFKVHEFKESFLVRPKK